MDSATKTQERTQKHFYEDLSFWALFISNLIVIIWAVLEKWDIGEVLWLYWCQSVIIGFFWYIKIISLKQFSTKNFTMNDSPVAPTKETKMHTANCFLLHFGFFHSGYLLFLTSSFASIKIVQILPLAIVFFIYQSFSFFHNRKWAQNTKPNIGAMLFFPYARVIPMHLTILFAAEHITQKGTLALAFFMTLKTLADVIMHVAERKGFRD